MNTQFCGEQLEIVTDLIDPGDLCVLLPTLLITGLNLDITFAQIQGNAAYLEHNVKILLSTQKH